MKQFVDSTVSDHPLTAPVVTAGQRESVRPSLFEEAWMQLACRQPRRALDHGSLAPDLAQRQPSHA